MQDNNDPAFVGRLCSLMPSLESVAAFGTARGIHLVATDKGATVLGTAHHEHIEYQINTIAASGSLWLPDPHELMSIVRFTMDERPQPTQDRRCFVLKAETRKLAKLSIDGSIPIPLEAIYDYPMPDIDAPEPTGLTVGHNAFMHAIPQHLAHRTPFPLPDNRLVLDIVHGQVTVLAQDRHATIATAVQAQMTQVGDEGVILDLRPRTLDALRYGDRDGRIDIGWLQDEFGYRVTLRSGRLTIGTRSSSTAPKTKPILQIPSCTPSASAQFYGRELRTMLETMVQDYADRFHASDVTVEVTLDPDGRVLLVELHGGKPDLERCISLDARVTGARTTVRVAASRLRHALDQLDARWTTLSVYDATQPLTVTEHNEPRVLVVPQAN